MMMTSYIVALASVQILSTITVSDSFVLKPQTQHVASFSRIMKSPETVARIPPTTTHSSIISSRNMIPYENLQEIGFSASVNKPLGVVFGENKFPLLGLVVDDVEPGLNGGAAGLREGDQLLAVNGVSTVGGDFDSVMSTLRDSPDPMELLIFRGSAGDLYGITEILTEKYVGNLEEEEEIVMDENYESPVQIEVTEVEDEEPLTVGEVFGALGKLAGNAIKDATENKAEASGENQGEKKGLFGGLFGGGGGGETIQLEGNDADCLK